MSADTTASDRYFADDGTIYQADGTYETVRTDPDGFA